MSDSGSGGRIKVDWTIPVWGSFALLVQGAAIVWWGADMNSRVTTLEREQASDNQNATVITRLDERSASFVNQLSRIESALDGLENRNTRVDRSNR